MVDGPSRGTAARSGSRRSSVGSDVDFSVLFALAPSPCVVLDVDLVVVEVNAAYCAVTGRRRDELVGKPLFEAFPDNPADADGHGSTVVTESLCRARDTGRPDVLPPQRHDVFDPLGDRFVERYWSLVTVPIPDADGRTVLLLHRPEEITDYVLHHDGPGSAAGTAATGGDFARHVEAGAEVYARSQELQAALAAEAAARRRLGAITDVALQLAGAQTVDDLTAIVNERGLVALGSAGGAIAVIDGNHLELSITSSFDEGVRSVYHRLPLDALVPACVAVATDRPVVLPDAAATSAFSPLMDAVIADTGCQAWLALPLRGEHGVLGSLTIGWTEAHAFSPAELEVLTALAAQCSYGLERIQVRRAEQVVAARDRRMSETLQRSLLTRPVRPDRLELVVRYVPAVDDVQVGGDWYDAFLDRDGTLCVVIGDVAGHDRNAAATMGQLRNLLRGITYAVHEPPAAILQDLDGAIRRLDVGAIATAVLAKVEQTPIEEAQDVRTVRWTNAGHPPPLVIEPDGTARLLETPPEILLGAYPGAVRHDHEHVLEPGSTLLLYTDGLVERRHADLDTGLVWLTETAARLADRTLDELCDELLAAVSEHAEDDVALLALRAHAEDQPRPPDGGPQVLPDVPTDAPR